MNRCMISGSVTFTTNRDWSVTFSEPWVHVNPSSGSASDGEITLTVRCDANTTYEDRSATLTLKAEDLTQTFAVNQPANKGILVNQDTFSMSWQGGTLEVEAQANVEFDVTPNVNWIHYVQTKALGIRTVVLNIDENQTYNIRSGCVTLKQKNGSLNQTITVRQAKKIAVTSLSLNRKSLILYAGESVTLIATVKPSNATDCTVTWTSSNTSVMTVDGNGKITAIKEGAVTITAQTGVLSTSCDVTLKKLVVPNAVDLGLSVKWASFNLGASKPEEYGDYYAWGDIEPKLDSRWDNYKWANGASWKITKYCQSRWSSHGMLLAAQTINCSWIRKTMLLI